MLTGGWRRSAHIVSIPPSHEGKGTGVGCLLTPLPLSPMGKNQQSAFDVPRAAMTPTVTPTQAHSYGQLWTTMDGLAEFRQKIPS